MKLLFRSRRIRVSAAAASDEPFTGDEVGTLQLDLRGRARLIKEDFYDGPGLDFDLPPYGPAESHVARTAVPALAYFATPERIELMLSRLSLPAADSSTTRTPLSDLSQIRRKAAAVVSYFEPDEDTRRRYIGPGWYPLVRIALRMPLDGQDRIAEWMQSLNLRVRNGVRLELDGIHFCASEIARTPGYYTADFSAGSPTWEHFIDGQLPVVATSYAFRLGHVTFRR